MGNDVREEESLFARAINLPRADRDAFLRSSCGENEPLRQRVEQLIEAHESADTFVDRPCDDAGAIKVVLREMIRRGSGEEE